MSQPERDEDIVAEKVRTFYDRHPYPPPVKELNGYRRQWQDEGRRRADYHLFWPTKPYREKLDILVAGCGTSQAARYALRHPDARIVGIDVSADSLDVAAERGGEELPLERFGNDVMPALQAA